MNTLGYARWKPLVVDLLINVYSDMADEKEKHYHPHHGLLLLPSAVL